MAADMPPSEESSEGVEGEGKKTEPPFSTPDECTKLSLGDLEPGKTRAKLT